MGLSCWYRYQLTHRIVPRDLLAEQADAHEIEDAVSASKYPHVHRRWNGTRKKHRVKYSQWEGKFMLQMVSEWNPFVTLFDPLLVAFLLFGLEMIKPVI